MLMALWTAASGMNVQQTNLDVIANNIANVNTTAFKASRASFQDLMYQTLRLMGTKTEQGNQVPTGIQIGHGARLAAVQKQFAQGDYQQTQNQLDLAIEGNGFLQIQLPSGEMAYTRAGSLQSDSEGRICTSDGYLLNPNITIPQNASAVTIATDGTVSVQVQNQTALQQIGTLTLWTFPNLGGLNAIGGEPLPADRRQRGRGIGNAGSERFRDDRSGIPRAVQRQRHDGDGQLDHRAEGV